MTDIYNTKLDELAKLNPNWDGYYGTPPSEEALKAARGFLDNMTIVPSPDGGVQIEWRSKDIDMELFFDADGDIRDFALDDPSHSDPYEMALFDFYHFDNATVEVAWFLDERFAGMSVEDLGKKDD